MALATALKAYLPLPGLLPSFYDHATMLFKKIFPLFLLSLSSLYTHIYFCPHIHEHTALRLRSLIINYAFVYKYNLHILNLSLNIGNPFLIIRYNHFKCPFTSDISLFFNVCYVINLIKVCLLRHANFEVAILGAKSP